MNNPGLRANELLSSLGWTCPSDLTIEEIAWACGLVVNYKQMDGCQGRILMNRDSGIITINSAIAYQPKINYVLAHEIGHSKLHRDIPLFNDTEKTLADWYSKGQHELEANQFAAELLMPAGLFSGMVNRKKLSLQLIEQVAGYFGASKTAAFLRYKELGDFPVMIIFVENGLIKWKTSSHDFPFQWLPYGSNLPAWTVAGDYFYKGVEEQKPVKVNAIEWFPDDFRIEGNESQQLWEQCFPTSRDSILTCLWTS